MEAVRKSRLGHNGQNEKTAYFEISKIIFSKGKFLIKNLSGGNHLEVVIDKIKKTGGPDNN